MEKKNYFIDIAHKKIPNVFALHFVVKLLVARYERLQLNSVWAEYKAIWCYGYVGFTLVNLCTSSCLINARNYPK